MARMLRISDHDHHRILALAKESGNHPTEVLTHILDRHLPPQEDPMPPPPLQERELRRLRRILNTPAYQPFLDAVKAEAAHQAAREDEYADEAKTPGDWYDLLTQLQDKARASHEAGNHQHALHHTISSAAVLYHWHTAITADQANAETEKGN